MSTLYLHIGTPKTGTTALQHFLLKNRSILRNKGCKFPVFANYDTGVHISHNGRFLSSVTKNKKYTEECFDFIFELAEKYPKIIITDEILWNKGGENQNFWKELNNKLSAHSIILKVIVYLRRQDEYVISHWGQKVKGRKSQSITFDKYLQMRTEEKNHLNYYNYLCTVADVIGKENIIVRPYEFCQFQGENQSIFSDFLSAIGIDWDENFKTTKKLNNQSLKGQVLEAKRYLNMIPEFNEKSIEFRNYFWEVQDEIIKQGNLHNCSTFKNNERQKFMETYNNGNSQIAREFLGKNDGKLFVTPLPNNDYDKQLYTVKEIQDVFDILLKKIENSPEPPISFKEFQPIYDKALIIVTQELSTDKNTFNKLAFKIQNFFIRKISHTS